MSLLALLLLACGPEEDVCTPSLWFLDADGDGFGGSESVEACEAPAGYTAQSLDCDDADPSAHPDGEERCDATDNDCDGEIDEQATDLQTFYVDADGDGFGGSDSVEACALEDGLSEVSTDCDDADPSVNPGAEELCDGLDNDCDPGTGEGYSVPGDFATLSEAVDQLADGERVCLQAGTYGEELFWQDKQLHIHGVGADQVFVRSPTEWHPAVELRRGDGSTLRGLTLQGLSVEDSDGIEVQDVVFHSESCGGSCGQVVLSATQATFTDVDIRDTVIRDAGADSLLDLSDGSDLLWEGGALVDNVIGIESGASGSGSFGGVIRVLSSTFVARDVAMDDNRVTVNFQGLAQILGLFLTSNAVVTVEDGSISGNEFSCRSDVPDARGNASCYALWYTQNDSELSLRRVDVSANTLRSEATGQSGQWHSAYASLGDGWESFITLEDVRFSDNELVADGTNGGCWGIAQQSGGMDLLRTQFLNNDVVCGDGDSVGEFYGLVSDYRGSTVVQNVLVAGNSAEGGGGTYGWIRGVDADLEVVNSTLHDNEQVFSWGYAGVLYQSGSGVGVSILNNSISRNQLGVTDLAREKAPAVLDVYIIDSIAYNSFYGNSSSSGDQFIVQNASTDLLGQDGNGALTPDYVDPDNGDFSLGGSSQLVDAGDPSVEDVDGSRSDIGVTGGPDAE